MHRTRTAFLALLLAVAPGAAAEEEARSQDEPASAATSSPGADGAAAPRPGPTKLPPPPVHRLDSVVVSATRVETPASEVASSVTVLDGEALRRQQHHLVVDALRQVPGVDVRRSGGPGTETSVFLRGAESDHTLVLVDGVELNDPAAPSRGPILTHLTLDNVERIEVLRGPQSGVWGSDAIGGVINIVTGSGEGPPRGSLSAEGGSFDSARTRFDVSGSAGPLRYALGGSFLDTEGFSAMEPGDEDDGYRNATGSARFELALGEDVDLDLVLRHTDARTEFDEGGNEKGPHTDVEQSVVRFAPRWRLFEGLWEQELGVRYARHERDTDGSFPSVVEGELFGLSWRHDLRLFEDQTTTLGLEGEWEEADVSGSFTTLADSARTWSAYLQQQFAWGQRVFGTLGARFDDHSEFGSALTYRGALGYRIPETGTTLRASYGTGFKAPSLTQLDPEVFGGNPDLDEERSEGFDVGVEQRLWNDRVTVGVTYFHNWFDDLIESVFDPGLGEFLNANVDEARALGVETFADLRLTDAIRLRVHYTHTDTEAEGQPEGFGLEEGAPLLRRPEHKAGLGLDTRWLDGRGDLAVQVEWVGGREDLDPTTFATVRTDDHVVVELRGGFQVLDWLRVFARVENLFDEDYQDVLGFGTAGISGYGGLEVRF